MKSRVSGIAGLVALAAGVAACGTATLGSAAPPSQAAPSPRAVVLASMGQVKTASYHFTMDLSITGLGSSGLPAVESFTESGAVSGSQHALEAMVASPLLASATLGGSIRIIAFYQSGTFYVSLPSGNHGGKWYEMSGGSGSSGSVFAALSEDSPYGYIGNVNGAVTSSKEVGTATIDGVVTTEYAVSENLRSLLAKVMSSGAVGDLANSLGSASAGQTFSRALTAALKALPPELTIHMYVDGSGHLRRLSLSIPLGSMFGALLSSAAGIPQAELSKMRAAFANVHESVTMDLTDYGAPVHVSAPPASEVVKGSFPGLSTGSASASASASASGTATAGTTGVTGTVGSTGVTGSATTSTVTASTTNPSAG